jgi:glycosyltransferase involved in cell wall biosynthesis
MPAQSAISVSVIIPVYNGTNHLAETLQAVLAQTVLPNEIIVIDDGSTDGSADLARTFGPAVKVVTQKNSGLSASRNAGAALATSDWFTFLDHDDIWEPNYLARHTAEIALHPEANICYCNRRYLQAAPEKGTFVLEPAPPAPAAHELSKVLLDRNPLTVCSVLMKRDVFHAVGGFSSRHDGAEDWDMWLRLSFNSARFIFIPETLVQYRVHPISMSHHGTRVLNAQLRVINETLLPHLSPVQRALHGRKLTSRLEGEASILMRENKVPGMLAMMVRSILRHPFHSFRRYKIAAHMLLHRTHQVSAADPKSI